MRRLALAAAALLALLPAPAARADGDPASDVLLSQDVFLPYQPNVVSKGMADALSTTVKRAEARGFGMKVAVLADPRDLGSAGQLFNQPQRYADLLTQELSLNVVHGTRLSGPRVLTVFPGGLGGNNLGDTAGDALAGLVPADGAGADGIARTAAVAVGKLAAAAGKPIAMPRLPSASAGPASSGGGGIPTAVLFVAPVLLVVLVVVALDARRGEDDGPPREELVEG